MIRRLLLSMVAITAVASTAFAADLPSRRAPPVYAPPPIPVFTWTGFYAGADVGYAGGRDSVFAFVPAVGAGAAYSVGSASGVIGGGHVGYNFSTQSLPVLGSLFSTGGFGTGGVIGIEGDVKGSTYRSAIANPIFAPAGSFETHRNDIQGSVRGRIGIAFDRALFFATGGVAFASFRNNYNDGVGDFASITTTRAGYTVGGGVEYAFTPNWSLRAEYRYEDFGRYTQFFAAPNLGANVNISHHDTENIATVGFSYKFDTPLAPVVARY